jgi:hypothetical protein
MIDLVHFAVRSARLTLVFRDWAEARALWQRLIRVTGVSCIVLMPDHIHVLLKPEAVPSLLAALRGFARWRNHHRGERGPVWDRGARAQPVSGWDHAARLDRYVHMNPCRAGLVRDPLAWPFSTHRDAVGLAVPCARRRVKDPDAYHRNVSADRSTDMMGTQLPAMPTTDRGRHAQVSEVLAAVSALTRTPTECLRSDQSARRLLIRAAKTLTAAPVQQVAGAAGVSRRTVQRVPARRDAAVVAVERVLRDDRFSALRLGDLRRRPEWTKYRRLS